MTEDQMKACLMFDIHVLPWFQSQRWPNSEFNNISNFHTFLTLKNNEKYILQSESTALLSTTCKFLSKWSNFIHSSTNSKVKDTFDSIITASLTMGVKGLISSKKVTQCISHGVWPVGITAGLSLLCHLLCLHKPALSGLGDGSGRGKGNGNST